MHDNNGQRGRTKHQRLPQQIATAIALAKHVPVDLVLCNPINDEFSAPMAFHSKEPCAGNGPVTLGKRGNAAVERHGSALRVGVSAPRAALRPLTRARAIDCGPAPCQEH
jgi:hypothetical protein